MGKREEAKWRLHPLIHTTALKELAQNVVGNPNGAECELKYVMHSPAKVVECCGENLETSTVFVHSIKYAGLIRIFCLG